MALIMLRSLRSTFDGASRRSVKLDELAKTCATKSRW